MMKEDAHGILTYFRMFQKKIILHSTKTKEDMIALLAENIEPWHKDSSSLIFEGKVEPDGKFNFGPAPLRTSYKTRYSTLRITGCITDNNDGSSIVAVKFSTVSNMRIFLYAAPAFFVIIALLMYTQIVIVPTPWFLPLFFAPFFVLNSYISFRVDVLKAEKKLASLFEK